MARRRTQIICLHEGKNNSTDPVFANEFLRAYKPSWIRPNTAHFVPCGGKTTLREAFPSWLKRCHAAGADTTLIVLADVDDDCADGDELKAKYRTTVNNADIPPDLFETVVFIFPKDRIENWVQFLNTGATDESVKGPRVDNAAARQAARTLAQKCLANQDSAAFPPSLAWSCRNWRVLCERMRKEDGRTL
jgi:hypothetical protein